MAFDTFDEGINPGGMRSKNEIKTLICYLYNSVKENIDACAVKLLAVKKNEIENKVDIVKSSNGFTVKCSVSGGDMDLMKLDVYAPEMEQALILKKNFLDNPNVFVERLLGPDFPC